MQHDDFTRGAIWQQRLAVAVDGPIEAHAPGTERLSAIALAYLDARRSNSGRSAAGALFLELIEQDLAALGAVHPRRAAHDLLGELDGVVVLEDAADHRLPREREALIAATGLAPQPASPGGRQACSAKKVMARLRVVSL